MTLRTTHFGLVLLVTLALFLPRCAINPIPTPGGDTTMGASDTGGGGGGGMDASAPPAGDAAAGDDTQGPFPDSGAPDTAGDTAGDTAADTDGGTVGEERCGELPLDLSLAFDGVESREGAGEGTWSGEAEVMAPGVVRTPSVTAERILRFRRIEDGAVLAVRYRLPGGWALPLAAGERVTVQAGFAAPWWIEHGFAVRDLDGVLRASLTSGSGPPRFEETCPPVETECEVRQSGSVVWPRAEGAGEDVLFPGEMTGYDGTGGPFRTFVARAYQQLEWFCTDQAPGWLAAGTLHNVRYSQCNCEDDFDCAIGERCETEIGRCVLDHCAYGDACDPGLVCDPYRGCVAPPEGPACTTTAECPQDSVCNLPLGRCVPNPCVVMDCAEAHRCSPLLGACRRCLADCDCGAFGSCVEPEDRCDEPACPADKVGLTAANAERYDYFVVCTNEDVGFEQRDLRALAPGLTCHEQPAALCADPGTAMSCTGNLAFTEEGPPTISPEGMQTLCDIARFPWVERVVGGHWVK